MYNYMVHSLCNQTPPYSEEVNPHLTLLDAETRDTQMNFMACYRIDGLFSDY